MKPNTSNNCECDCHIQIGGSGKPCPSCIAEFKQGYAKCRADVEKIVDNWYVGSHSSECMADVFPEADLIRLKQEIAKLKESK